MQVSLLFVAVVVLLVQCASARVSLQHRKLLVNDDSIFVKGVGYAPVPIGADPTVSPPYGDYFTKNYAASYKRDLVILRGMGVNTLRLWGWDISADHSDFLDACYNGGVNPIYVAAEFWMGPGTYPNLGNPLVQQRVLADFKTFLYAINSHPAILFYILGSDLNADWNYAGQLDALFAVLSQLAVFAHQNNTENLVTTALNDLNSVNTIQVYDPSTSLDFWSLNVYRGCSFGPLFTQFAAISKKGLFVSEYGIDSYNDVTFAEDDALQANCLLQLSKELIVNNGTALGGAVVEYVDEYWKGKLGITDSRHPACPNYNASRQTNCGYPNSAFPDLYANQAWFGIVNASFSPRTVYATLQKLWTNN